MEDKTKTIVMKAGLLASAIAIVCGGIAAPIHVWFVKVGPTVPFMLGMLRAAIIAMVPVVIFGVGIFLYVRGDRSTKLTLMMAAVLFIAVVVAWGMVLEVFFPSPQ